MFGHRTFSAIDENDLTAAQNILSVSNNVAYKLSDNVQKALFHATNKGNLAIIDALYNSRALGLNAPGDNQATLFFTACAAGHVEIAQYFMKKGQAKKQEVHDIFQLVDINRQNRDNDSPLFAACAMNRVEVVKYLLTFREITVSLNAKNYNGVTPFFAACSNGHEKIVELLLGLSGDLEVNINKRYKEEKLPKEWGTDEPNEIESQTALYIACKNGHPKIVEMLLKDKRIDIDLTNRRGETPFYATCQGGKIHVIRKFQEKEGFNFVQALITPSPQSIYPVTWILCQNLEFSFIQSIVTKLLSLNNFIEVMTAILKNVTTLAKQIIPHEGNRPILQYMMCSIQARITGQRLEDTVNSLTPEQQKQIIAINSQQLPERITKIIDLFPPANKAIPQLRIQAN